MPGKKGRKIGTNKKKCQAYRDFKQREKNKIVKIARSSGLEAAMHYAMEKGLTRWAQERLKEV